MTIHKTFFDECNARVGVSVGVSISTEAGWVKPSLYLEVDVPEDLTVDQTIDGLEDYLIGKLVELEEKLDDLING